MKLSEFFSLLISIFSIMPGMLSGQQVQPGRTSEVPRLLLPAKYHDRQLPAVVDNSLNDYWPGTRDQLLFNSCQQVSGVEYVFGYEINRLRNKPGWYWENSYPAHYTWNFMNEGEQEGVNFLQSFEVIKQQGHMTYNDYGEDKSVLGWITGYDKYYRGMFNHLRQVYAIEVNSNEGINTLRNYLYDHLDGSPTGGIVCFTTNAPPMPLITALPAGTPEAGKKIIPGFQPNPNHGLTVVGYNDSIRYDLNQDGKYTNDIDITGDGFVDARDWEIGGFKIANTFGNWWADEGFAYALYSSFAWNYGEGGIWNNRVYLVEADTAYQPQLTLKVNLNYNARSNIRIQAGVSSDTLHREPDHIMDFPIFNFQGAEHVMQGFDSVPEAKSIEFGLDVTSLLNFVPSGQPARYFLIVEERDPFYMGQGTIQHASFISYRNTPVEIPVKETDVAIKDNNTTMVSAVASFEKPGVQITTSSLPPYSPSQPVQVQLEASGGRPPYDWSFAEEYFKKPVDTQLPLITGTSIIVPSATRSFSVVALPFSFPFYGKRFDSIFVNYFGFISFEPQNLPGPYISDEMGMLRRYPLIVPSFSPQYAYVANKNDGIWVQADATRAIIRWKASVSGFTNSSTNDFGLILYPDGRFEICYGAIDNQGFVHSFYKGVSRGDDLNFDIQPQWNANDISGKSFRYYPPVIPAGLTLTNAGFLSVNQADSSIIYGLHVRAADAGKISDSKILTLSGGLDILDELICGDDARLIAGRQASLKLILTNNGPLTIRDLILKIHQDDSIVQVTDSMYTVPLLIPGQTLTIPAVFSFRLNHALPNDFPVMMTLQAQSAARSWKKELLFPVAAPEIVVEPPYIVDGYNEKLDPGEIADLHVDLKNLGATDADDLQLTLNSLGPDVEILSAPLISIDHFDASALKTFSYQIKASRSAIPGVDVPMRLSVSDSTGLVQPYEFNLQVGTRAVAIIDLAASHASAGAMINALKSLHAGFDTLKALPFELNRYGSVFLILGTTNSGTYTLTDNECSFLTAYLQQGGNLYMESYFTWYYHNKTPLHPMFKYTTAKIPAWFYPEIKGIPGTFTESMSFGYSAPVNYAIFNFEPVVPAYSTLTNTDNPAMNLEIVYHGSDYKTIGSLVDFSGLNGGSSPSTQTTLMQRYLDFFDINLSGPYPLFHTGTTSVCPGQTVTFTDDSFDNIISRSWEFPGGTPATGTGPNPSVRYDFNGKFDVKLTVSDGIRAKTILKQNYIQVGTCSGTEEHPAAPAMFRIFPNPATDQVVLGINRNISGSYKLILCDLTGRKLAGQQGFLREGNHDLLLKLTGFRKGIYFVSLQVGSESSTLKLMVN